MQNGYIRDPEAFDPTAYSAANDRRHLTGPGYVAVTVATHPILFEVFEAISSDSGGGAGHSSYSVPLDFEARANRVDKILSRLSAEERETVAVGERNEAFSILALRCPDAGERLDIEWLLNSFFEDWCEGDEDANRDEVLEAALTEC